MRLHAYRNGFDTHNNVDMYRYIFRRKQLSVALYVREVSDPRDLVPCQNVSTMAVYMSVYILPV